MSFLDEMESNLSENKLVDEELVEEYVKPEKVLPKKKVVKKKVSTKTSSRDVSTKIIESRMRVKLDKIGLNEAMIDDVVSEVLEDVNKVVGVKPQSKPKRANAVVQPEQPIEQIDEAKLKTVVGRAESILGDEPYNGPAAPVIVESPQNIQEGTGVNPTPHVQQSSQFNEVANKASSLLS